MNYILKFITLFIILLRGFLPISLIDKTRVLFPLPNQAVLGVVEIIGEIELKDFTSYQLFFAAEGTENLTWFPISTGNNQGEEISLGFWDTNSLSDGEYSLKLFIEKTDGQSIEIIVPGVRVRNYTPYSTLTPTPFPTGPNTQTPTPTIVPNTPTAIPPTDFPTNPINLTFERMEKTFTNTLIVVFSLFSLLLIFRKVQKRK